jgi:alkylation response protein AidB-like acyl-CoA dehydrogenase
MLSPLRFNHGETIDMLRESVAAFAAAEIAPRAAEIDASNQFPMDLWQKLGALGVNGITVPEADGGAGLGYLAHVVVLGNQPRVGVGRPVVGRSQQFVHQPDRPLGHGGAKGQISAGPDQR